MYKPELLAPAGSWEALVAAVQNGADAVYLGGKNFNARQNADNFDNEKLKEAVEYCHVRGVKIYVAVNILIADAEMSEALSFLYFLHNIGVDAIIIQDLGLARLAAKVLPDLPLHASTQMTVHNAAGVKLLQECGMRRIVLSREVTLENIQKIKEETGADLEVFIHGALCVSYSGQCLMSSMIGGRSGNRGSCAQPCRLQYQMIDIKGKQLVDPSIEGEYLLSPKDLNMSQHLPELIAAGINSFKVEGRMKRPEYVATVIDVYRKLIDKALTGDKYEVEIDQKRELAQIFNREFTTGFFYGNQGKELMSFKRPNNRGILLGRVKSFRKGSDMIEIALQEDLQVGDGVEAWVTKGGRVGTEVHQIICQGQKVESAPAGSSVWISIPGRINPGDRIFKTKDALLLQKAKISYTSSKEQKKIPLRFEIVGAVGKPLSFTVTDNLGYQAQSVSAEVGQVAEKRPLTEEKMQEQVNRLGNTPFVIEEFICNLDGKVIFPMREINELRRQVLTLLEEKREISFQRQVLDEDEFYQRVRQVHKEKSAQVPSVKSRTSLAVNVTRLTGVKAAVDAGADIIYFGGESYRSQKAVTVEDVLQAAKYCRNKGAKFVLSTPRIMQEKELATFRNFMKPLAGVVKGVLVSNWGLLELLSQEKSWELVSDFNFNVFNQEMVESLAKMGIKRVTMSPELTMSQLKELVSQVQLETEAIVHGAMPLMVTEYCAMGSLLGGLTPNTPCTAPCHQQEWNLKDRKDIVFPVRSDQFCHQHIFNSRELCLIDDLACFPVFGVSVVRIDARLYSAEKTALITECYRRVLNKYPADGWDDMAEAAKEKLAKESPGLTKGHYYRGVI